MKLDLYMKTLDTWAIDARAKAEEARAAGDERMRSIHLMRSSMMGDMLKAMGRAEIEGGRIGFMEKIAVQMDENALRQHEREDFDEEERSRIKAQTIRQALALLREGEQA